jgi:hypothetical protein
VGGFAEVCRLTCLIVVTVAAAIPGGSHLVRNSGSLMPMVAGRMYASGYFHGGVFRFRTGYSTETETTPDRIMPRARAALSDTSMTRP